MTEEKKIELIELISDAALKGGQEILKVYDSDFAVEHKDDRSPLTEADKKAHQAIMQELQTTNYPILSEEGRDIPYQERADWPYFWMVDPLDGTKEFVKRNGEFTVNIALIHQQRSIMGVVYVPVKDELYFGASEMGSFKVNGFSKFKGTFHQLLEKSEKLPLKVNRPYTIVGSRSHMSDETLEFMEEVKSREGEVDVISVGSSLKLCMVAEGKADAYPRFAPTMEWDTAAGQAIVESMGGKVINWETKNTLKYNREELLNPWFLVTV